MRDFFERIDFMQEKGIYYFHQGTNYYAYDLMGCHYTKEATTFRVWAPNEGLPLCCHIWVSFEASEIKENERRRSK